MKGRLKGRFKGRLKGRFECRLKGRFGCRLKDKVEFRVERQVRMQVERQVGMQVGMQGLKAEWEFRFERLVRNSGGAGKGAGCAWSLGQGLLQVGDSRQLVPMTVFSGQTSPARHTSETATHLQH